MPAGATRPSHAARVRSWRPAPPVLMAIACFVLLIALNAPLLHEHGLSGDEPYYERIATHPAGPHNFPYAFRIGLPYLVHVLPFGHAFSWTLLALIATSVAAGAMFALLRDFAIDVRLAAALAFGFALSPPLHVVLLRNGRSVDAAAVMLITLGTLFIVRRQKMPLGLTLLASTTVHESCLFLIPLAYAVWAERLIDLRALREVVLVGAAPVLVYVYLRTSIVAVGETYQPGYNGPFLTERVDVVRDALQNGGWKTEIRRLAIDFGPLWIAAPFALPRLSFARRGLALVVCCALSMTFALDWGRAMFFAAPVIYVGAAYVLRSRKRLAVAAVIALFALDVGYIGYMQIHGVRHSLDTTAPPARGPVY